MSSIVFFGLSFLIFPKISLIKIKNNFSFKDVSFTEIIPPYNEGPNEGQVSANIETTSKSDNLVNITMEMSPIQKNANSEKEQSENDLNRNVCKELDPIKADSNENQLVPPKVIRRVITGTGALQKKCFYNKNLKKAAESTSVTQTEAVDKSVKVEPDFKPEQNEKLFLDQLDLSLIQSSEYEVSNLRQLNDAIERGKIQVYPEGTPRTPIPPKRIMDKMRMDALASSRRILNFNDDHASPDENTINTKGLSESKKNLHEKKYEINILDMNEKSSISFRSNKECSPKVQNDLNISAVFSESPVLDDKFNPVSMLLDTR